MPKKVNKPDRTNVPYKLHSRKGNYGPHTYSAKFLAVLEKALLDGQVRDYQEGGSTEDLHPLLLEKIISHKSQTQILKELDQSGKGKRKVNPSEVYMLKEFSGLSSAKIAERLSVSKGYVDSLYRQAMNALYPPRLPKPEQLDKGARDDAERDIKHGD